MFKGIAELLLEVLEKEGHGSIERMARNKSRELGVDLPAGTLYSWMTKKLAHRRRPRTPAHTILVSSILRKPVEEVVKIMAEEDARDRRK